jgi:uncharacterized protein
MTDHGLSAKQMAVLKEAFAPYAQSITQICLFGSRATGRYKPSSDIDLVVIGPADQTMIDRVQTVLNDSSLAVPVDVLAYDLIEHRALKAHVDAVRTPLFDKADLLQA